MSELGPKYYTCSYSFSSPGKRNAPDSDMHGKAHDSPPPGRCVEGVLTNTITRLQLDRKPNTNHFS